MVKRSLHEVQLENPLERLGLFIKDEFLDEDEETIYNENGEEGEIFSRSWNFHFLLLNVVFWLLIRLMRWKKYL